MKKGTVVLRDVARDVAGLRIVSFSLDDFAISVNMTICFIVYIGYCARGQILRSFQSSQGTSPLNADYVTHDMPIENICN